MNRNIALLGGVGLGAGVMYFLDPTAGRRRRAIVRDKMFSWTRRGRKAWDTTSRSIGNRAQGARAGMGASTGDDTCAGSKGPVPAGACSVSHPSAISVNAQGGRVILAGDILKSEVDDLMNAVAQVPGVTSAENRISDCTIRPRTSRSCRGEGAVMARRTGMPGTGQLSG